MKQLVPVLAWMMGVSPLMSGCAVPSSSERTSGLHSEQASHATLVVTALPNPEAMKEVATYSDRSAILLNKVGAQIVRNMKVVEPKYGSPSFAVIAVIDFPTRGAIEEFFSSDEYQELVPVRRRAFRSFTASIVSTR